MVQELSIFINGKWKALDPPDEAVAMNFQVNTLAEFKDRNASYSQAITLPRSPRNERILGIRLRVDAVSPLAYRSYPCELLSGGSRVSPAGAVLRISSLKKDYIGVQILGANADLVEVLKAKSTETVKADGFGMVWMNSNIKPSGNLPNGVAYHWVYANLVKNLLSKDDAGAPEGYIGSPDKVYPMLNFQGVVQWILEQEGYVLDLPQTSGVELAGRYDYIPALVPKCAQWNVGATAFEAFGKGASNSRAVTWNPTRTPIPGMWGSWQNKQYLSYYATWDGNVTLRMAYTLTNNSAILNVRKNDAAYITNHIVSATSLEDFTIKLKAGDHLFIQLSQNNPSSPLQATASVRTVLPKETKGIAVGAQYDLLASLGFSTRADIVQEFLRMYGLTMLVDPVKKSVLMYPLSYILDNKEDGAVDWSSKLVPGTSELTYQVGSYARKNTFGLKPDETNGIRDTYTFEVDDSNLDEAKDLWTSKFLAIVEVANGSEEAAPNFPIYEVNREATERTAWSLKYSKPSSPAIVRWLVGGTRDLQLTQGYSPRIWQVDDVSVAEADVIPASYFAEYYAPLWNTILNKAKAIQVTVNLNALDIEGLDLSKPVWFEQYGYYFYISKVVNYIPGKLTKVNLIRI